MAAEHRDAFDTRLAGVNMNFLAKRRRLVRSDRPAKENVFVWPRIEKSQRSRIVRSPNAPDAGAA